MNKIFISDSINFPKRILFLNKKLCSQLLALFSVGRVRSQNFIKTGAGAGEDTNTSGDSFLFCNRFYPFTSHYLFTHRLLSSPGGWGVFSTI